MSTPALRRRATHAGSWYDAEPARLEAVLEGWLRDVDEELARGAPDSSPDGPQQASSARSQPASSDRSPLPGSPADLARDFAPPIADARAIIAPHAGYAYSGAAAAWAYRSIPTTGIKRVFVLGPSHHVYLDGCALSRCESYATPLGDLPLDVETIQGEGLAGTGEFAWMDRRTDEDEHSIEMHLPYISKVFQGQDIKIVPILVGAISTTKETRFGEILAPFLADPENFFVVSSDFCHWGSRFSYTFYRPSPDAPSTSLTSRSSSSLDASMPIHLSIRHLDNEGMQAISFPRADGKNASQAKEQFAAYLKKTKNTVCGRHPIGVLLGALAHLEGQSGVQAECRFVRYEQSSECETPRDSSVSYASAFARFSASAAHH